MPDPNYPTSIRQAELRDSFKSEARYQAWLAKVKPEKVKNQPATERMIPVILRRRSEAPAPRMFAADEARECTPEFLKRCARMGIPLPPSPQPNLKSLIPRIAAALAKCPAPDFRSPYGSIRFLVESEPDAREWLENRPEPPMVYEAERKFMVVENQRHVCWSGEFHGVKLFGPMFPL